MYIDMTTHDVSLNCYFARSGMLYRAYNLEALFSYANGRIMVRSAWSFDAGLIDNWTTIMLPQPQAYLSNDAQLIIEIPASHLTQYQPLEVLRLTRLYSNAANRQKHSIKLYIYHAGG